MRLLFLRHGMTKGNQERRYIGVTDEPLSEEGREMLRQQMAKRAEKELPGIVFVSPLRRCRETAQILFPGVRQEIISELAEMDFGIFENRAYQGDLEHSPEYQKWLESRCEDQVPEGERKEDFTKRCREGFEKALGILKQKTKERGTSAMTAASDEYTAAFVVHGGTIMAILSVYAKDRREYYEWNPANGRGFAGSWNGTCLERIEEI